MFFLGSIRRRLVTGFTLMIILVTGLAGTGLLGLFWHQHAVSELEYALYKSPNRDQLTRSFVGIRSAIAPNKERVIVLAAYTQAVGDGFAALDEFTERFDALKASLPNSRISRVQTKLNAISDPLKLLKELPTEDEGVRQPQLFRSKVTILVDELLVQVDKLDTFHERIPSVPALQQERERSAFLRDIVGTLGILTFGLTVLLLWCGFQWFSNPLRQITLGASRIAEGDHPYRIPPVLNFRDEFYTLRNNVNLMAERFEQAEKDLNEKVRERSNQLVRSERLAGLGFLSAGVAHEINNPLSIIRVAADTLDYRLHDCLKSEDSDRDEIFERLKMIRTESVRCGEITARILDFARGEQQEPQLDDLTHIIESVLAMIRPMPNYQDRTIEFSRSRSCMLLMNSAQMKQVMLNLVFNALQATDEGGRVDIRLIDQVDWVVLEVEDDGCGMSCETMANLFEPFYSTKPPGQGTGLGMPITHRIVAEHDGTLEPVSAGEGQGSLMRIRLPIRQTDRDVA